MSEKNLNSWIPGASSQKTGVQICMIKIWSFGSKICCVCHFFFEFDIKKNKGGGQRSWFTQCCSPRAKPTRRLAELFRKVGVLNLFLGPEGKADKDYLASTRQQSRLRVKMSPWKVNLMCKRVIFHFHVMLEGMFQIFLTRSELFDGDRSIDSRLVDGLKSIWTIRLVHPVYCKQIPNFTSTPCRCSNVNFPPRMVSNGFHALLQLKSIRQVRWEFSWRYKVGSQWDCWLVSCRKMTNMFKKQP